jgi:hypothetical protein
MRQSWAPLFLLFSLWRAVRGLLVQSPSRGPIFGGVVRLLRFFTIVLLLVKTRSRICSFRVGSVTSCCRKYSWASSRRAETDAFSSVLPDEAIGMGPFSALCQVSSLGGKLKSPISQISCSSLTCSRWCLSFWRMRLKSACVPLPGL